MKTRLIMIIALTITLFSLILGLGIGMKKAGKTGKQAVETTGSQRVSLMTQRRHRKRNLEQRKETKSY